LLFIPLRWPNLLRRRRMLKPTPLRAPPRQRLTILRLVVIGVISLGMGVSYVLTDGFSARVDFELGERPSFFVSFLPTPWNGEVSDLAWASDKPPDLPQLPTCALYLGAADGVTVVYDHANKRTLRIPSATLIVTTHPDRDYCL
jgi:hypothetical protein